MADTFILVKAQDNPFNPDDPLTSGTGFLIHAQPSSQLTGLQVPPKFCQIQIPDEEDYQSIHKSYCVPWNRVLDWEVVDSNLADDEHQIRLFSKAECVSVSGLNSLTRAEVENYLTSWNCTIDDDGNNFVLFTASIFGAVRCPKFWGVDVSLAIFTELGYSVSTGIHQIQVQYSGSDISTYDPAVIDNTITRLGGEVISHDSVNKVLVFNIHRSSVRDIFKIRVKNAFDKKYAAGRFKLPTAYVAQAIANGGTLVVSRQDIPNVIYDRLND